MSNLKKCKSLLFCKKRILLCVLLVVFLLPSSTVHFMSISSIINKPDVEKQYIEIQQEKQENKLTVNNPIVIYAYYDLVVHNSYAYLITDSGIDIWDVSSPTNPTIVHKNEQFNSYMQIESQGNYTFLLRKFYRNFQFNVINISNSNMITNISACRIFGPTNRTTFDNTLIIQGNFAYIVTNWQNYTDFRFDYDSVLSIVDLTNISEPVVVSNYQTKGYAQDLAIENDTLFLVKKSLTVHKYDPEEYYTICENMIEIINISNKSNPILISKHNEFDRSPRTISIQNNHAFVGYKSEGLDVYDISDVNNLNKIISFNDDEFNPNKICNIGDVIFVLDSMGLEILDSSDYHNIKKLGEYKIRFQGDGSFTNFIFQGEVIFASRITQNYDFTFYVFDISNREEPKLLFPLSIIRQERQAWLTTIILGYIVSPIITISILTIVSSYLLKNKKKRREGIL